MKRFLVDVSVSDSTNMADFCNTPSLNLLLDFFLEVFRCVGFAFPPHAVVRRQRLRHALFHHRQPDLAAAVEVMESLQTAFEDITTNDTAAEHLLRPLYFVYLGPPTCSSSSSTSPGPTSRRPTTAARTSR